MGENLLVKDAFAPSDSKQGEAASTERLQLFSLPLVPYTANAQFAVDHVREKIGFWLHLLSTDEKAKWHSHCFPEDYRNEAWQRETLNLVCKYHHHVLSQSSELLKLALHMSFVNYLIGHPFTIPHEEVLGVFAKMKNKEHIPKEQPDWVCPRAVDRFLKRILLPLLRTLEQKVLEGLEALLLTKPASIVTRETAFCVTFMVLIVAAITQINILNKAIAARSRNDTSALTMEEAKEEIRNIEKDIVDHLLSFWHYSFRIKKKLKGLPEQTHNATIGRKALQFDLFEQFKQTTQFLGKLALCTFTTVRLY